MLQLISDQTRGSKGNYSDVQDAASVGSDVFVMSAETGYHGLPTHESEAVISTGGVISGALLLDALPSETVLRLAAQGVDVCSPTLGIATEQPVPWRSTSPAAVGLGDLTSTAYTQIAAHVIDCQVYLPAAV